MKRAQAFVGVERSWRRPPAASMLVSLSTALALWTAPGCDFSSPSEEGVQIRGVSQAAPRLEEFDQTGQYKPYYATGEMKRPRYFHQWANTVDGLALVFGGSDERGYSAVDTVELFDQSQFDEDRPRPQSLSGLWIDTNFEGDPIAFENGGRMLFTVTPTGGKFFCVGGTGDLYQGAINDSVEIFDPDTRSFETLEAKLATPRIRHTAVPINDGGILICAGETLSTVTVINPNVAEGQPGRQQQVTVFITTNLSEVYSFGDEEFSQLTLPGTSQPSKLTTPRGRCGHAMDRIAGPDNRLRSGDDIFLIVGGFQTLSGQSAPRQKLPGAVGRNEADGLTVIEFFDPLTKIFTQVGSINLASPRVLDPYIMNLGWYSDFTIDGVRGMGNTALITHGNTDGTCPVTPTTDELLVANYTGFGPAQGLQFFRVEELQFGSHQQGIESDPPTNPANVVGRCATNPVPMPRRMKQAAGTVGLQTWVLTASGVVVACCPCAYGYNEVPAIGAGCVFDPYYSLPANYLQLSTRDLVSGRTRNNPTGIIGCWLTLDGQIPTVDLTNFGTPAQPARWARPRAPARVFTTNIPVAGEDGVLGTPDDRLLLAGGGGSYEAMGGEATSPSAEILLPPGVNNTAPWD